MISPEPAQRISDCVEPGRISFSSEFLDESNFISICPNPQAERERQAERIRINAEFEFLSGNLTNMMTADELFSGGKLLPFWQIHHADKLTLKSENGEREIEQINKKEESRIWFIDDDPSPRPPKCTVLWKELLKLKKQKPSTLSPSTSSSSSSRTSLADAATTDDRRKENQEKIKEKSVKRIKKSTSIRIRPVLNVPICSQGKNSSLPTLFSLRKGRLHR